MSDRARWGTYQQIAESLRARFTEAPEGQPVPSEAELGREFGVSRTVVRRALALLKADGVVRTVPGIGRGQPRGGGSGGGVGARLGGLRPARRDVRAAAVRVTAPGAGDRD